MKKCKLLICLVLVLCLLPGCGKSAGAAADTAPAEASAPAAAAAAGDPRHIQIEVKDYGTISLELYPDKAPETVANFISLAQSGFYNGLTFHRIMDGFMMQGGDPTGTGMGGASQKIRGEFAANGVDNDLSHVRGAISMARSQDMNSASSQFFIVQSDSTFLDGQYAAFGMVTEGLEVVDRICADARPTDNNGSIPAAQQPVMTAVTVID